MSIQDFTKKTIENNDETLEFPLRLSKLCLLSIRDDNTFISPLAIEAAFHALSFSKQELVDHLNEKLPLYFYNYFILDKDLIESLPEGLNEETTKQFNTEFQIHTLTDIEQRKTILNELFKDFSQRVLIPIVPSQKILGQIIVEPMTLVSCCSFTFRPLKSDYWEELWSLKFHSNIHLSIETEFYFTKGFFRLAFHDTFHKIEIPGQIFHGLQTNLIILLPQCSSDLVHLYANIKEYLNLPSLSAFIGVCIPKISMDIDMNLIESLKVFEDLHNLEKFNEHIQLAGARSLGHFSLDITPNKVAQSTPHCLHSIDLSPVTPWIFLANRPFLFFITYGDSYILVGQMLGPKLRQDTNKFFSKLKNQI